MSWPELPGPLASTILARHLAVRKKAFLTDVNQHIRHILLVHRSVVVAVENLESLSDFSQLRRG